MKRDGALAVANRPSVAVLVIVFARRGRAEVLIPVVVGGFDLRRATRGGVDELSVLAGTVLEEQQIRELNELREEHSDNDQERRQRRGPSAAAPADAARQRALGSRAAIHQRCR